MISQSGGVATDFGYEAPCLGIGLSKVISFGNGCDLDATDLLEYLAEDQETGYIAAYLEGIRNGRRFLDILRRVTPKKPVVIWKGGLTPLGGRAALGHTGSMGGKPGFGTAPWPRLAQPPYRASTKCWTHLLPSNI